MASNVLLIAIDLLPCSVGASSSRSASSSVEVQELGLADLPRSQSAFLLASSTESAVAVAVDAILV
jgi:hypothetical protein